MLDDLLRGLGEHFDLQISGVTSFLIKQKLKHHKTYREFAFGLLAWNSYLLSFSYLDRTAI